MTVCESAPVGRDRVLNGHARSILERSLSPDEWAEYSRAVQAGEGNEAFARELARKWQSLIGLRAGTDDAYRLRLERLGLDEENAHTRFLPAVLRDDFTPPDWALLLDQALAISPEECREAVQFAGSPSPEEREFYKLDLFQQPAFPCFLAPFLACYLNGVGQLTPGPRGCLLRALVGNLSRVFGRTAAHELKLAKNRLELRGATPEERHGNFFEGSLGEPDARVRILLRYPVLARLLSVLTLQAIETTRETLTRLAQDREEIESVFLGGVAAGVPIRCFPGLSDPHRGGRSAWLLEFESGLKLLYKPRSHEPDTAFAKLADWLSRVVSTEASLPLRTPRILAREEYGWSEFIPALECESEAQVARYYRRQGVHAAIFYFLCGQDFHGDNFIAHGEHPVAIDLEGLLAPSIAVAMDELASLPRALRLLQFSAAGALMLPYWRSGKMDRPLFQASGIGGTGTREWPFKQPEWVGVGTDSFGVAFDYRRFTFDTSVPRFEGVKASVFPYLDRVNAGFEEAYRAVLKNREELLAAGGPLERFRELRSRMLFRDTQDYSNLLFWTTTPDFLTSGSAHDIALDSLASAIPVFANGSRYPEVLEDEKQSLWARDIPIANAASQSTDMFFPSGRIFGPVIRRNMFDQAKQRIAEASERDLEWQTGLIHSLFEMSRDPAMPDNPQNGAEETAPLLAYAAAIGDDLERIALRQREGASWLSLVRYSGAGARVHAAQYDPWTLNGTAGNALFLINLAAATGEKRYEALGREGLRWAALALGEIFDTPLQNLAGISAYVGSFALVYALAASGVLLGDEGLIEEAAGFALRHAPERLEAETNPDFLTGVAGPIVILTGLHRLTRDTRFLDRARILAGAVSRRAVGVSGRNGWQVPAFQRPLCGMAHGSSGIAAALLSLYRQTGDPKLLESAVAGLRHESDHFHAEQRDWPNLQEEPGHVSFMTGWCAGAPGAGIARLMAADLCPVKTGVLAEIECAIEATRRNLGGYPHHLCCGEAGRIALLEAASRKLDRPELHSEAVRAAHAMIERRNCDGHWRLQEFCEKLTIPGLLGGVPGIGITFLSLANPSASRALELGWGEPHG